MKIASHRSSGVALVVTLILLAIITFMTVTLLVLSRSQKGMVTSTTEANRAQEMTKIAMRNSLAMQLASVKAFGMGAAGLAVSTNFTTPGGYQTTVTVPYQGVDFDPVNVNYAYPNGQPVAGNDALQNTFNLLYSPRAPVYVLTNRLFPNNYDFRWYVDLNRNGRFETNGWLPELDDLMRPVQAVDGQGNVYTPLKYFVGDPEWIGVLEKPEYHHSATNRFIGRYAYIILPASKTLDLNYAHNYAKGAYLGNTLAANPVDGFMRNQGATTFEINLAAFLADLNTNYWPLSRNPIVNNYWWPTPSRPPFAPGYAYYPVTNTAGVLPNGGWAFAHANALIRYRYANSSANLQTINNLFGTSGRNAFASDWIDGFAAGPLMVGTWWPVVNDGDAALMNSGLGWSGSYNPYHFYTHQDFFDPTKTTTVTSPYNLTTVLQSAGAGSNTYNRYTLYRMLAQLGVDTGPGDPESSKINLNYVNVDNYGNVVPYLATNFVSWDPGQFFTNTVNKLLNKAGFAFGINNIQIYPTNYYSASVHRILQLAANVYDATTNRTFGYNSAFPSVFRPIFLTRTNKTQVFIVGYQELADHAAFINNPPLLRDLAATNNLQVNSLDMVKGIPLVIGARKGFPNFNEFELRTTIEVGRKLSFRKHLATDKTPYVTNQMYMLTITNEVGLEAWNSYTNAYPRNLQMLVGTDISATMSNQYGALVMTNFGGVLGAFSNYVAPGGALTLAGNTWRGFNSLSPTASFLTPLNPVTNHFALLPTSTYSMANNSLVTPAQTTFESGQGFPVPQWTLNLRSSVRFVLYDQDAKRIVDYVNLVSSNPPFDITSNLTHKATETAGYDASPGSFFLTNRAGGVGTSNVFAPTMGIINQIATSLGQNSNNLVWNSAVGPPAGWDTQGAINFFRTNLMGLPPLPGKFQGPLFLTNNFEAPYAPMRNIYLYTSWQANDPLVHYTVGDLTPTANTNMVDYDESKLASSTIQNIGALNSRYEPWPGNSQSGNSGNATLTDMRVKDPGVTQSSDWDFPTNKFPNPGWLGRIHRGTPWQTVYLKAQAVDLKTWQVWTGNGQLEQNLGQYQTNLIAITNYYLDAAITCPTNDWRLLDVFTTSVGDAGARGQLSINQTNLAAWSAVLGGVAVNPDANSFSIVQPAGAYWPTSPPPMITLYNAINDVRRTNYNGAFSRLGDLLSVPELTTKSPFVNPVENSLANKPNLTDSVIERIPQQVLGLLKGGEQPRFVVYCYGQALKPAERSKVSSGPFLDLVTNYQVTAEIATRAVVRIEGAPGAPHAIVESYNVLPPD